MHIALRFEECVAIRENVRCTRIEACHHDGSEADMNFMSFHSTLEKYERLP